MHNLSRQTLTIWCRYNALINSCEQTCNGNNVPQYTCSFTSNAEVIQALVQLKMHLSPIPCTSVIRFYSDINHSYNLRQISKILLTDILNSSSKILHRTHLLTTNYNFKLHGNLYCQAVSIKHEFS